MEGSLSLSLSLSLTTLTCAHMLIHTIQFTIILSWAPVASSSSHCYMYMYMYILDFLAWNKILWSNTIHILHSKARSTGRCYSNIAPYICQHLTLENPFKRTLHSLTHSHPPSNHHTAIITTENTLCGLLLNASQLQVFAGPRLAQAQGPNPQATVYSNRKTSTTFHGQLNKMLFTEVQGYLHVCNKHL